MKAVYVERVGPPEVLIYGELPAPQPGPNDVLIRVHATSLNGLDVLCARLTGHKYYTAAESGA